MSQIGSRVEFIDEAGNKHLLHMPHPFRILKPYQINNVLNDLKEWRYFNE